jgi:SanA protein
VRPLRSAGSRTSPRWRRLLVSGLLAPLVLVGTLNAWVLGEARGRLHEPTAADMPAVPIAMVLGTSPRRPDGMPNRHFQRRLDAAAALYAAGNVQKLVVSGATAGKYYDEPRDMRAGLIARGVPESAIVQDRRGVRTFDSVLRLKDDFHATRCAIISDAWHVPRALFIADRIGLDAVGVRAQPVPLRHSFKARVREWLARVLVVLDMYVLETKLQSPSDDQKPSLQ